MPGPRYLGGVEASIPLVCIVVRSIICMGVSDRPTPETHPGGLGVRLAEVRKQADSHVLPLEFGMLGRDLLDPLEAALGLVAQEGSADLSVGLFKVWVGQAGGEPLG